MPVLHLDVVVARGRNARTAAVGKQIVGWWRRWLGSIHTQTHLLHQQQEYSFNNYCGAVQETVIEREREREREKQER
jgi:hypothetical protein